MRRYSWTVILFSMVGFLAGVAAHLLAYFQLIPAEIFLLYCRAEWLGAVLSVLLLGWFMPTTAPRRQVQILAGWMAFACCALLLYLAIYVGLYLRGQHPRKLSGAYGVVQNGRLLRTVTESEYVRLANAEAKHYLLALNRAFSMVWIILFFGIAAYGVGYIREARRLGIRELSPEKFVAWWYAGG